MNDNWDGSYFDLSITLIITNPNKNPNVWPAANKYPPAEPYPIGNATYALYAKYKDKLGIKKNPANPDIIHIRTGSSHPLQNTYMANPKNT